MSKALRTIALVAASVALIATGVGAFAGTTLGIATIGGGSAAVAAGVGVTAASVAAAATAVAAAASIGAAVTAKAPPLPGTATKFLASTSAPLPYVMGRTAVGGSVIYRRTHSVTGITLPDLQTFGIILSACGPVDAIESFSVDNVATSFTSKRANGSYRDWMFQATQLGATPEASALSIDGLFVTGSKVTSAPPGWGASAKLSGYAAALWTLRYDAKGKDGVYKYGNGIPKPLWILRGVKVYDPRQDSTYPGGSGSCRALNEATYVYSTNPYLHALTFALGRFENGKRVMGIGAPVSGIDVAAFVEGANVAQANGWHVGGVIYSSGGKWGMLKAILQAGGGEPFHLGAQISCLVSTPRVTIATITTDDVVGEASVTATTPRRDRINSVIPRYRSEAHNWEMISATPVTVAAHVTTDGGLRTKEIEYGLVQDLNQAAALARYDIENAREFGPIVLPVKTRWVGYKPGDCVAVALPEVGLNGQAVVIRNRALDPDGGVVTLTARSETNAKHAFALGQTTTAPPTPGVTAPPVAPTPGVSDWTIAATALTTGGSVTPALIVTGATGDNPVDGVQFEYRLWVSGQAADVGWIDAGTAAPGALRREISAVLPGTRYDVAVSYILRGFPGGRRILGPVTTSGEFMTPGDNLITNAGLAVDAAGWSFSNLASRQPGLPTDPAPGYIQFPIMGVGVGAFAETSRIPVSGAPRVFVSGWCYRVTGATGAFYANLFWFDAAGGLLTSSTNFFGLMPPGNGLWTPFSFSAARPANATFVICRFVAENISQICNIAGPRLALTQRGADVTEVNFAAGLQSGGLMLQDSGSAIPAGAQPFSIMASDGVALAWALDKTPLWSFDATTLPALAAGESYSLQLTSVTGSGGTPRLKKRTTGGAPATVTSAAGTAIVVGEDYSAEKGDTRDARDGIYSFRVQGQFDRLFSYTPFGGGGGGGAGGSGDYERDFR